MDSLTPQSCPSCGRAGIVNTRAGERVRCPVCGASFKGTTAYTVDWNDSKKQFDVSLAFPRPPTNLSNDEVLQILPQLIAENSFCGCGARLLAGSHSFNIQGNQIKFTGTFRCTNCTGSERSLLGKVREGVAALWKQLAQIKIGASGIEIEKK